MNKIQNDEIRVTHIMGGFMEFERTGIYPNRLRIKSTKFNHTWRINVKDEIQSGILKIKREPVYHYVFDETGFRIQEVMDNVTNAELLGFDMIIEMRD